MVSEARIRHLEGIVEVLSALVSNLYDLLEQKGIYIAPVNDDEDDHEHRCVNWDMDDDWDSEDED